mmetsp:Transcript_26411/g.65373  ORF Transcript_26411/g.65373 Transcript_26411/m.65373 type:complete len:96 (-) Transcript_26411:299-586(-)
MRLRCRGTYTASYLSTQAPCMSRTALCENCYHPTRTGDELRHVIPLPACLWEARVHLLVKSTAVSPESIPRRARISASSFISLSVSNRFIILVCW